MATRGDPKLDRSKIVATALDLLDEVGLDKLSTRTLADRLGVSSPALYWHFRDRQALVDAMAEEMLTGLALRPIEGEIGDWLADRARAFRAALLAHRDGARVHAGTRPFPSQLPALDASVAFLVAAGYAPDTALRTNAAISRYVVGCVIEEQAADHRPEEPPWDVAGLPALAAAVAAWDDPDPVVNFEFGLQALISGLTATPGVRRPRSTGRSGSSAPAARRRG